MLRVYVQGFGYIAVPIHCLRIIGDVPYISPLLQLFLSSADFIRQQVSGIVHRDISIKSSAGFCYPLIICPLKSVLVACHGITVLHFAYLNSGRIILHVYPAHCFSPEHITFPWYRNSVLIPYSGFRFPPFGGSVRISLLAVVDHIIPINLKCRRTAFRISFRRLDLHQDIRACAQWFICYNVSHRYFLCLSIYGHFPDSGICPKDPGLISLPILLLDQLGFIILRDPFPVQTDRQVVIVSIALPHSWIKYMVSIRIFYRISFPVNRFSKQYIPGPGNRAGPVLSHITFCRIQFKQGPIMYYVFTCLPIQLFNPDPGTIICILKILLGKCHKVKIRSAAGRYERLHISRIRIYTVCGRRQHGPGDQHGGKLSVYGSLHSGHNGYVIPYLRLTALRLISMVGHLVQPTCILAL